MQMESKEVEFLINTFTSRGPSELVSLLWVKEAGWGPGLRKLLPQSSCSEVAHNIIQVEEMWLTRVVSSCLVLKDVSSHLIAQILSWIFNSGGVLRAYILQKQLSDSMLLLNINT